MPAQVHGIKASEVHAKIKLLIDGMVNITDTTGEFLVPLPDGTFVDAKGWNDWEWTHGVGLNGLWAYYDLTGDETYLAIIQDWFAARFASGSVSKNINTMAVFLSLAYVYEKTGDRTYLPWLEGWGNWAYHDLERTKRGGMQHITYIEDNEEQLWDDTLMMTVLPLAKIGQVLARPEYVEEAKKQFLLHVQYLVDTKTGLFYHGWTFDGNHNFAGALWGRGNAWLTMAIPDFLDLIEPPPNDPVASFLIEAFRAQCEALKGLQMESGLWRTLLDQPVEEGSYPEASATAGFAYGMLKGQRLRYLGKEYQEAAFRAVEVIMENVDEKGELENTSYGTAMGHTLQHYKDIPITSMPYGQAMAIMALTEFLRTYV